jgi:hypothetical protein
MECVGVINSTGSFLLLLDVQCSHHVHIQYIVPTLTKAELWVEKFEQQRNNRHDDGANSSLVSFVVQY